MKSSIRWTIVIFLFQLETISAEKIIFIFPLTSGSESMMAVPLAKELASKGHLITFVSPLNSGLMESANITEITPVQKLETADYFPSTATEDILEHRRLAKNPIKLLLTFDRSMVFRRCHQVYQNPSFQNAINDTFDLVIISGQLNNCFQGLVHKFQAPFVVMRVNAFTGDLFQFAGLKMPASFVPNALLELQDKMIFHERLLNTLVKWLFSSTYEIFTADMSQRIYRQYLGQDYPALADIEHEVSMIFSNSYFPVNSPRPLTPEIVEIGGLHCREPRPLPKDLMKFLADADEGFIFFSMGSMFKSSSFSNELKDAFVRILSGLKQKVLWTSDMKLANMSSNILVKKWFPQQDILGHPKIRIFITHGGIQSYLEAVYHGVPQIVIPIWSEQSANGIQVDKFGNGVNLEVLSLNHNVLETSIQKILTLPSYSMKAKELSVIMKDQPQSPLDRATYWIEYVLRHKGALPLRTAARDLNSFQYHSLDVILFLLLIGISCTGLFYSFLLEIRTFVKFQK